MKKGTVLRFFWRGLPASAAYIATRRAASDRLRQMLCRKHTMAMHPYPAIEGWKKEIRSSANEKTL
jgi:hypothetical protein